MRFVVVLGLISTLSFFAQPVSGQQNAAAADVPNIKGVFGSPTTFGTHDEFASYGFAWGPADGQFGAIHRSETEYTFYGSGASARSCTKTPDSKEKEGVFAFTGSLDHVTGGNGCTSLFGP